MPPLDYSTGPKYPSSTTTTNGSGISGQWANPANIYANDASNATAAFLGPPSLTDELAGAGFNFDIPANAIIDGIIVEMHVPSSNRWSEGGSFFRLKKAGSVVGSNKAGTGSALNNVWTYGGATDLWGTTWTPAQINAANFGISFVAAYTSSGNDFTIAVNYVRITVKWHYDFAVTPAPVPKRYAYKVFDNAGQYLGNIPKVLTPFGFSEDIETAGATMLIEIGMNADITREPSRYLTTELGERITTEDGNHIMVDGGIMPITVGTDLDNNSLLKNGNRVVIVEYSYYYPNGKPMYSGQINKVGAKYGGTGAGTIKVLLWNDAYELDNYPARGVPPVYTEQQSQQVRTDDFNVTQEGDKGGFWQRCGQTIKVVGGNIAGIWLGTEGTARVTVTLYDQPNGQALTSSSQDISTVGNTTFFAFPNLITGLASAFIAVSVDPGQSIRIARNTAGGYSDGGMYTADYAGGSGGGVYAANGQDLYFIAYSGAVTTAASFTGKDPTLGMLVPVFADYNQQGGKIVAANIDATGLSLAYDFSVQTIFEVLRAVRDMSPDNFYWRIDMGTNELEFKRISTTADFTLIKGIHINELELWLTTEGVKNKVLFTGGEVSPGVNLYSQYINSQSIQLYGPRLDRKSDNRVTQQLTADAIGNSFIAENSPEKQQTTITIPASVMDITKLTPGKVVGFGNFGNFIDQLKLLIVRRDYTPNAVTLTVGTLKQNLPTTIEQIKRDVVATQTVDNPSAPS